MRRFITQFFVFSFDLLNGFQISRFYKEIARKNDNLVLFSDEQIRNYLNSYGIKGNLDDQPLSGKPEIRNALLSVPADKIKSYAYTGGSYGEPLKVPVSKRRSLIRTASIKYFNGFGNYKVGDRYLFIRAKQKPGWEQFLRNEILFIPNDLSDARIEALLETLIREKVHSLIGYPSVIYQLALYVSKTPAIKHRLRINSIISVSEPLDGFKKQFIHEVFPCPFIDRYSNEEVGMIAQQREFGGDYYVDRFGVVVEVLDPETRLPVAEGQEGRVVVTDLNSDLVPIVRYDTGDNAVVSAYKEGQLISIKSINGRTAEVIYSTTGQAISSLILGPHIYKPLSDTGLNLQFQFAQTGAVSYALRLRVKEQDISPMVVSAMVDGLKTVIGTDADLQVSYVEDIKPQPSGKRPIYKNEMKAAPVS